MKSKNFKIRNCQSKEWNVDAGIYILKLKMDVFSKTHGIIIGYKYIMKDMNFKTYKYRKIL